MAGRGRAGAAGEGRRQLPHQAIGHIEFINHRQIDADWFAIHTDPPTARAIAGVTITPRSVSRAAARSGPDAPQLLRGAIYDADGKLLPEFAASSADHPFLNVRDDPAELDDAARASAAPLAGRYLYGGELKTHFGHFLLETLARGWSWSRPEHAGLPVIFHDRTRGAPLHPTMERLLEGAGLEKERIVCTDRILRLDELILPEPEFEIDRSVRTSFRLLFDRMREEIVGGARRDGPEKIYLSRRLADAHRLVDDRIVNDRKLARLKRKRIANEDAVEAFFAARGFAVIYPEKLPIQEQIGLIGNAKVIAGVSGSALHSALFNARADASVLAIDSRLSINQVMIELARGIGARHILCTRRDPSTGDTVVDCDLLAAHL